MSVATSEIERFNRLSVSWWDSLGPMRPLHVVNALRLHYVVDQIASHRQSDRGNVLRGLRILDVGCGGGLMSEALARLGAEVVGVDASEGNIVAARRHATSQGVAVDYRLGEPTSVLSPDEQFDVILVLEVVEHVTDVRTFLASTTRHLASGGLLFVSTINRTIKSFFFVIIGAEYVFRVLPRGTHRWPMFVRPQEVNSALAAVGLQRRDVRGMQYLPVLHRAAWCNSTQVNYIANYAAIEASA